MWYTSTTMAFFLRILLGLAVSAGGFLIVWKTQGIVGILGYSDWAERHMGSGGTYSMYKIIGIIVIFIGFAIMAQLHQSLIAVVANIFIPGQ